MPGPPLEERAQLAIACSSGRIVCNRLTTAPGPDPVPPAAHLRASTVQAGHPVVASTAACGRRLGGGPARDGLRHLPRPRSSTDRGHGVTPHSLRPNYSAQTSRVPRNVAVRARALRQRSRALSGTFFVIKSGSDLAIGPTPAALKPIGWQNGGKMPQKGGKMATFAGTCYVTCYDVTPLLSCDCVNCRRMSDERQIDTTIYSSRTCVENLVSQNFEKAQKRSIS
jgi:hypothetical protein